MSMGMGTAGGLANEAVEDLQDAITDFASFRYYVHSANGKAGALIMNGYASAEEMASIIQAVIVSTDELETQMHMALNIAKELKDS